MADANGNEVKLDEVKLIADLQECIARKLNDLGYVDGESAGDIIHHLAEVAVLGNKLFKITVPRFLALPAGRSAELADVAVDLQTDLEEMKDAISEMEPHLLRLVNFLNP